MSFGIQLPCIEFEAEVHVYGEDVPAPLEEAALRFIHARACAGEKPTLDDLVDFLSVGKWLAYQILIGFWTRGWALIYPESGKVELSRQIAERLKTENLEGMQPAVQPVRLRFIYDLVAGQIAPHLGERGLRDDRRSDDYTYPKRLPRPEEDPDRKGWQRFDMPLDGYLNVSNTELQAALVMHSYYRQHLRGEAIEQLELKILKPARGLTPGMVRYYSVYFDVYKTGSGELRLEVNDDRPIQQMLGKKLASAIVTALPDGPRLEASLNEAANSRDFVAAPASRPLPKFVDLVRQLSNAGEAPGSSGRPSFALRDLAETWAAARIHMLDIAARRVDVAASMGLSSTAVIHDHLRQRLRERNQQIVLSSPLASPDVLDRNSDGKAGSVTELLASLESGPSRLFLTTTRDSPQDIQVQFAQMENDNTLVRIPYRNGPHVSASFAAFDVDMLLMSSEPLLTDVDQSGLSLVFESRSTRARGGPLLNLLDRLAKDIALNEPGCPQFHRSREFGPRPEVPPELRALIDEIDSLIAERVPKLDALEEVDAEPEVEEFDPVKAAVWLEELKLLSQDLESWVLQKSQAAEILVDSEIHDAAISLLERTPEEQPVVVGLSHVTDLSRNLQMRDAIARRLSTCTGQLYLCLPGDSHLDAAVKELTAEFADDAKVTISRGREGARWGFGFVLTAAAGIIATRGVGQRIQNIGRARRGTEVGVLLFGPELRKLALEIISNTHALEEASRHLELTTEWSRMAQPAVLRLYSAWFGTEAPQEDGNRGVTVVEELLENHPGMPWRPGEDALKFFPDECRHALLKSAARRALGRNGGNTDFDDAPSLLATKHWNDGELLQAAIMADWNGDSPIGHDVLREMALAVSLDVAYVGNPQDFFAQELDSGKRTAFLSLAALLLLDGRGGALATFLNALDQMLTPLELGDAPLDRLVVALARRDAEIPGIAFDASAVTDLGDAPDLGTLWQEAANYVTQRRIVHSSSVSVVRLRDLLFKHEGSFPSDLAILFADEAPNTKDSSRRLERLREVLTKYEVKASDLRPDIARACFERAHDEILSAGYDDVKTKYRPKEEDSVLKLFKFASNMIAASECQTTSALRDREILQLCKQVIAVLNGEGVGASDPIAKALAMRLEAGRPRRDFTVPIHLLPTAADALSPLDWNRLQNAYLEAELSAKREGISSSSVMPLARLLETMGSLPPFQAPQSRRGRWKTSWKLLDVIERFGAEVATPHDLHHGLRTLRSLVSERIALVDQKARRLHLSKARNELVSGEFDDTLKRLKQNLDSLKRATTRDSDRVTQAVADDLDESESLLRQLEEHYRTAFEDARHKIDEETKPGKKRPVRQLLDAGQLDAARWLSDVRDDVPFVPPLCEPAPDISTLFQSCLQRSRFDPIPESKLGDHGVPDECIALFAILVRLAQPARTSLPKAEEVGAALFAFLGVDPGPDDLFEDVDIGWRVTTANRAFVALAPYLVARDGEGTPRIVIVVPRDSEAKLRAGQAQTKGDGWRRTVFGRRPAAAEPASTASLPRKPADAAHALAGLAEILKAAGERSSEPKAETTIPLMIDAFPFATIAPLPGLTHRQVIGFMGMPVDQRRRACTRTMMSLASPAELTDWWHRYGSRSDEFKRWALELMHGESFDDLAVQGSDDVGLTNLVGSTAEMLGVRINPSEDEDPAFLNWCNLRFLIYFSGGNLLNAHDLLFDGLWQDNRRRFINLQAAVDGNKDQQSINRFQRRMLPEGLAPQGDGRSADLALFFEAIELASFEDDEPGFVRDTFLAQAKALLPHLKIEPLFDDMVAANLIIPLAKSGTVNRFESKKIPWLLSLPETA